MNQSIVKNSLLTFGTRLMMFVLQGLNGLLLARLLGPAGRGQYALLILVPSVATVIFNFGVSSANAYFVSSGRVKAEKMLGISLLLTVILGGTGILLMNVLAPVYWKLYPTVSHPLFRVVSVGVFFMLLFNYIITIFQGRTDFRRFNGMNVLNPLIFLLAFLGLVMVFQLNLRGAVIAFLSGYAAAALAGLVVLLKTVRPDFRISGPDVKKLFGFSAHVAVGEIVTFLNYRFDMFLVGYFLSPKAVGFYAVAVLIAETLWYLSSSVGNVLLPSFGSMDKDARAALLQKTLHHILWISIFMILILFLMDKWIINSLFGRAFLPSVTALRGLYFGVIALSLAKIISSYILAEGKPNVTKNIAIAGFTLNILLNIWWIPKIGILGAALASSIAYAVMAGFDFYWLKRNIRMNWKLIMIPSMDDFRFYKNLLSGSRGMR